MLIFWRNKAQMTCFLLSCDCSDGFSNNQIKQQHLMIKCKCWVWSEQNLKQLSMLTSDTRLSTSKWNLKVAFIWKENWAKVWSLLSLACCLWFRNALILGRWPLMHWIASVHSCWSSPKFLTFVANHLKTLVIPVAYARLSINMLLHITLNSQLLSDHRQSMTRFL